MMRRDFILRIRFFFICVLLWWNFIEFVYNKVASLAKYLFHCMRYAATSESTRTFYVWDHNALLINLLIHIVCAALHMCVCVTHVWCVLMQFIIIFTICKCRRNLWGEHFFFQCTLLAPLFFIILPSSLRHECRLILKHNGVYLLFFTIKNMKEKFKWFCV